MISQITKNLFIGEYLDVVGDTSYETAKKLQVLKELKIYNILSLCSPGVEDQQIKKESAIFEHQQYNPFWFFHEPVPCTVESAHFCNRVDPLKFGLELALYEIHRILYINPNAKILVHCTAGIDRSPFVVASYLVRDCYMSLVDAYKQIKKVRPFVCEHPEWVWWEKSVPKQVSRVEIAIHGNNKTGDKQ